MLDRRPFSDVCSTVSCWALLFSVILPSMQVMGVKVTTPATAASPTSDHHSQHLQKHSQQQQFLLKTTTFSLTVYLDPTFQQTLPMSFLSDPPPAPPSSSSSSSSSLSNKKDSLHNGSWKEQEQALNSPLKRLSVIGQDVNRPVPAELPRDSNSDGDGGRVKSISSDKRRIRRGASGNSRTIIVDQGSAWSRSSLFLPLESDSNNNEHRHDAKEQQQSEEGRIGRGVTKGPRRLSRHRYPHALIHRLYSSSNNSKKDDDDNNNPPESDNRVTTPKSTVKVTRRIEVKKRPSRLQRLLLLDELEKEGNVWQAAVDHSHHQRQQQTQKEQEQEQEAHGKEGASAARDDLFYYPTDQDLTDMMNFIMDEGLPDYFISLRMDDANDNNNDNDNPNDSPFVPKHKQERATSPASSSSSSPSFLSPPSLSTSWTQTDIAMARALWDYWEELDAMDLIQAQLESQLDKDHDDNMENMENMDNIEYETFHLRQDRQHPRLQQQRSKAHQPTVKSTLWKGRVQALIKDGPTNLSYSQDGISGPMMRFPFSGPMPIVPQKWIALMPCPILIEPTELSETSQGHQQQQQAQTGRNPTLPLDATAIVFYATADADCRGFHLDIDDRDSSLPPLMVLDTQSAQRLLWTLDGLSYGTTAMAALTKAEADSNATAGPSKMNDDKEEESAEAGTDNVSAALDPSNSFDMKELPKAPSRPPRRQIVISIPEIASLVDSFTEGATIRARRVLVNLGLDTQGNTDEQLMNGRIERNSRRDDKDYYRPLTDSMLLKNGGSAGARKAYSGPDTEINSHGQNLQDNDNDNDNDKSAGSASASLFLQRHSKTRTRPNRLPQRGHHASHSQLLDQVQSLILLKEYPQYRGHQSIHHRLNPLHHNNNNLPLTHPNNTTLSGKVAMVLMSTVCGVGVGMFGALLFVVALKVRLFQSRRSNNSGGALRHATAAQQQQAHQQMRENGLKKVIPLEVLKSYGVQTVLHTSSATTILTAVSEKSKAKMALLSKGPKVYAEDVIEMEEGLEDAEARANARQQRLERRRRRVSGSGQLGLGRGIEEDDEDEEEEEEESGSDEDDSEDDDGDDDGVDEEGYVEIQNRYRVLEHHSDNDDGEEEGDQIVPQMRSTRGSHSEGGTMDMEQITAAIMTATRQGSYRRVSYSRQGYLNDSTASLTSSYSSSSSSSSGSSTGSGSSSRSMERALTSSFSSSLSRSAGNPRGCTHSITHSHGEDRTRRSRRTTSSKKKKAATTDKNEPKTELPFANANAQTMCSICLAEYEVGEQVRTLPCYHQYHQGCIDPWLLNVAALCPICKRDLFPHGSAPPSS